MDIAGVPDGAYAVENLGGGITFLRFARVAAGPRTGWVLVEQEVGDDLRARGYQRPGASYRGLLAELVAAVVADPPAAAARYGTGAPGLRPVRAPTHLDREPGPWSRSCLLCAAGGRSGVEGAWDPCEIALGRRAPDRTGCVSKDIRYDGTSSATIDVKEPVRGGCSNVTTTNAKEQEQE